MAQPKRLEEYCGKCHCKLDNSNNGPQAYTRHHILPKRYYHGTGPVEVLCRQCHNIIDMIVLSAEGKNKKNKGHRLAEKTYIMLHNNFMQKGVYDDTKRKRL